MSLSADLTLAGTRSGQPSAHHGPAVWTSSTGVYSSLQLQSCSTMSPLLAPSCPSPAQPRAAKGLWFCSTAQQLFPSTASPPQPPPPSPAGDTKQGAQGAPATNPPQSQAGCHITCPIPLTLQGFWQVGWITPTATAALTWALSLQCLKCI